MSHRKSKVAVAATVCGAVGALLALLIIVNKRKPAKHQREVKNANS